MGWGSNGGYGYGNGYGYGGGWGTDDDYDHNDYSHREAAYKDRMEIPLDDESAWMFEGPRRHRRWNEKAYIHLKLEPRWIAAGFVRFEGRPLWRACHATDTLDVMFGHMTRLRGLHAESAMLSRRRGGVWQDVPSEFTLGAVMKGYSEVFLKVEFRTSFNKPEMWELELGEDEPEADTLASAAEGSADVTNLEAQMLRRHAAPRDDSSDDDVYSDSDSESNDDDDEGEEDGEGEQREVMDKDGHDGGNKNGEAGQTGEYWEYGFEVKSAGDLLQIRLHSDPNSSESQEFIAFKPDRLISDVVAIMTRLQSDKFTDVNEVLWAEDSSHTELDVHCRLNEWYDRSWATAYLSVGFM